MPVPIRWRRLATWVALSLLLAAGLAWTLVRPDIAIFDDGGNKSYAFGWRRGSVFVRTYAAPVGPRPVGDWVAENRALPPGRRWGLAECGVTRRYQLAPEGARRVWTLAVPLLLPLAMTSTLALRGLSRALADLRLRQALRRVGHCPNCGYDLRATPSRCPECGWRPVRGAFD